MKNIADFSAVIFDMDGLVLDTESTYIRAWQQAADSMGYDSSLLTAQVLSGLHYQAVIDVLLMKFGTNFDFQHFSQLSGQYWHEYVQKHGIAKKSGFDELLIVIRRFNIPYCLATNSAKSNALECLALAGLTQTFPFIVSRDDVKCGKPAPDIFLTAAQRLQCSIQNCLVLEDSQVGIQAAKAAGAIPVLIPSLPLANVELHQNITVFADLHHVANIIQQLFS